MTLLTVLVISVGLIIPTKTSLHMFQQNRYELTRYTMWLQDHIKTAKKALIKTFLILLTALLVAIFINKTVGIAIALYYSLQLIMKDLDEEYITPLVYTARVYRQIAMLTVLYSLMIIVFYYFNYDGLTYLAIFAPIIPYLMIYLMHILTNPIEQTVKNYYQNDAFKKLNKHQNLIKIGITGSYGKTSSKNILNEILSEQFYTLQTPKSFNTPMGITITIRQDLKNTHEVFIVEMGADKVGDIKELSDFINPNYAIITAIGPQHLATFKNIENIINEKMTLVEQLPSDGVAIINKDNAYINNYQIKNNCKVISYGIKNEAVDYLAKNIKYSIDGSSFDVLFENQMYHFQTRLLGEHNVLNILSAIALGRQLNVSWERLVSAVSKIRYIQHRLELKTINGLRFIDNAFNSNPEGANMSLKVISQMPNKRFIITPGMIDLGPIQDEENYKFGFNMKDRVDVVILVGKNQTQPIYSGLVDAKFNQDNIYIFDTVKQALNFVHCQASPDDIILLENDLPDAFSN